MKARDLVYETAMALDANRARSLLTILGVVIGIAAVIAMTGMIGGVRASLYDSLGMSQTRLVNMYCYTEQPIMLHDIETMEQDLADLYDYITPNQYGSATATTGEKSGTASIRGTFNEYADLMGMKLMQGRYFSEEEADDNALVVVLGQDGVKTLFGSENAQVIDKTVRIGSADFTIVGVA